MKSRWLTGTTEISNSTSTQTSGKTSPDVNARGVRRINNERPRNPCRAGVKRDLLRPRRGVSVRRKIIPQGEGARSGCDQTSGEGMVGNSGHLHEVQAHRKKAQIPGDLREKSRGPGAAGPGGHGKVRKGKQRLPLDTDDRRNAEPVRLCDPRLQKGHQKHDGSRRPAVGKILREVRKVSQRRPV